MITRKDETIVWTINLKPLDPKKISRTFQGYRLVVQIAQEDNNSDRIAIIAEKPEPVLLIAKIEKNRIVFEKEYALPYNPENELKKTLGYAFTW